MTKFQNGLFGCFNNSTICILTFCIPCYPFGKAAEAMDENCLLWGGLYGVIPHPFSVPLLGLMRTKVRDRQGIEGNIVEDFLLSFFCPCCILAQMAQECEEVKKPIAQSMWRW